MRCTHSLWCVVSLAFVALSGCASSPGSALPGGDQTARVQGGGAALRIRPGEGAAAVTVAFPMEEVWRVLPAVLDSLGIPIGTLDGPMRVVGNTGLKVHKRLGSVMLSKYIDCGQAQGFASADDYDVHLSVLTQIEPGQAGTSSIATLVEAAARPMAYRGDYSRCTSKNELETRIVNGVRARLTKR